MSTVELVAVNPPLECFKIKGIVRPDPTTLVMHKNLYADEPTDYKITDTQGATVVTLKAKDHSLRDKRKVVDAGGQELFVIQDKLMSLHTEMVAKRDGIQLFKVIDESTANSDARMKVELSEYITKSGDKQTLELLGDWFGDNAQLSFYDKDNKRPGQVIVRASRNSMEVKPGAYDDQTYFVTVAPGVDLAIMAGIAVCFDEIRRGLEYGAA